MRKLFIDDNSAWVKYQFEIINVEGIDFISIVKGSQGDVYNPLTCKIPPNRPKTWEDHLNSSPHIALARIDPDNREHILKFVNKWGLLGLRNTSKYNIPSKLSEIFNSQSMMVEHLVDNELFKNNKRKIGERDREPLVVFQQAIRDFQNMVEGLVNFRNYSIPADFNSKKQKEDTVLMLESIFTNYMDKKEAEGFVGKKISIDFLNDPALRDEKGKELTEALKQKFNAILEEKRQATAVYHSLNDMLKETSSQLYWSVGRSSESRGWAYKSLLAAIYLRVSLDLEEGKHFKHCEWHKCNRIFISHRPDIKTCSNRCRNSLNVHLHTQEKLLAKTLEKFPKTQQKLVEELFKELISQGYSGDRTILRLLQQRIN